MAKKTNEPKILYGTWTECVEPGKQEFKFEGEYYLSDDGKKIRHGKTKIYVWEKANIFSDSSNAKMHWFLWFEGESKNGKQTKGKTYLKCGHVDYEGEFLDEKYHGKGKKYYASFEYDNCSIIYEGEFKNGLYHGKGKQYYKNGNLMYEGDFENDRLNGKGKLYRDNGILWYEGDFKNSKCHGIGKLYWKNGNLRYVGQFEEDQRIKAAKAKKEQ